MAKDKSADSPDEATKDALKQLTRDQRVGDQRRTEQEGK